MSRRGIAVVLISSVLLIFSSVLQAQTVDTVQFKLDSLVIVTDSLRTASDTVTQSVDTANQDTVLVQEQAVRVQNTGYEISGVIKDKNTGEGVPFATVFFPGTPTGTAADLDGNFSLRILTFRRTH